MKKSLITFAAIMAFAGAVSAADLSSVGETGTVVTAAGTFDVEDGVSYEGASLGAQQNFAGLGTIALDVASDKGFNDAAVTATYANGLSVGPVKLVGAVSVGRVLDAGLNSAALAAEAQLKLVGPFVAFVGVQESYAWSAAGNWSISNTDTTATAGTYVKLGNLVGKVGYGRTWLPGGSAHSNGVVASLSYKF